MARHYSYTQIYTRKKNAHKNETKISRKRWVENALSELLYTIIHFYLKYIFRLLSALNTLLGIVACSCGYNLVECTVQSERGSHNKMAAIVRVVVENIDRRTDTICLTYIYIYNTTSLQYGISCSVVFAIIFLLWFEKGILVVGI